MEIRLSFDGHEEYEEAMRALTATRLCGYIHDMDTELRRRLKYADSDADYAAAEELWNLHVGLMESNNVDMDGIYS